MNETYNNVGKLTLDGFEQYGGKVTGSIEEFEIKSKQNTSEISGSSTNYSAGTNMQTIGTASGPSNIWNNAMEGLNGSIGGNTTTGSRTYVDTPSVFMIGEGSDLSIGKATNTGAIIGTEEGSNGKIKIKEYEGIDLKNSDTYNITGGTVGSGGVGVEYQDKEKEGTTHNTVIGNVVIDKSTGDEVNRDINMVQETTKDKDSGYYNPFVESGVLALGTKEGREQFKGNIGLAGENLKESLESFGIKFDSKSGENEPMTEVFKVVPGTPEIKADLTQPIDSYSGNNKKVLYLEDENGNLIYAEDISDEQNNYVDANTVKKGDYSVRSKFGLLYVDKNDYTGKAQRIYLSGEAAQYDMLNNVNVLSSNPSIVTNKDVFYIDSNGVEQTVNETFYGMEYSFKVYPVEVYDKSNKNKVTVYETTTAYAGGGAKANLATSSDELTKKGIGTTEKELKDILYGHTHAARTSMGDEKYSEGDLHTARFNGTSMAVGTPGCSLTGNGVCGIGQPKSWIYYSDINQVRFLGNIQDYTGTVDTTRFKIDNTKNLIPIEFQRDKNGLLIPR